MGALTPCSELSGRALLNHLLGLSMAFRYVEIWEQPRSWEGESTIAGNVMPNDQVAMVALDELALHGWDLAAATGQSFDLPEGTDPGLYGFISALASESGIPGLFGPEVSVLSDAPPFDHMLAVSGRDPRWRPEAL